MRHVRRTVPVLFLVAVALGFAGTVSAASAEEPTPAAEAPRPMLWVVDSKPRIYLFGTIHLGDPRVLDLPEVVKRALADSQTLYTEIALADLDRQAVIKKTLLPEGRTLEAILPKDLYARTNTLFEAAGFPLKLMNRFKVWAVWMRVHTLDIDPAIAAATALDASLAKQGEKDGKKVGGLETVEEQLDIFDSLSLDEQIELLEKAVDAKERADAEGIDTIERLTGIYLRGDPEEFLRLMYAEMDPDDALSRKLMSRILDVRNVRMVKRMLTHACADPAKTYFVAVGAAHMPGESGILALLRKTGYRVRRLTNVEDLEDPFPLVRKKGTWRPPAAASPVAVPVRAHGATRGYWCRRHVRVGPFCLPVLPRRCCPCP